MDTGQDHNKYILYTTNDFLSDDFFISSVREPSVESDEFWFRYIAGKPDNTDDFFAARQILICVADEKENMLPDSEVDELLERIMAVNRAGKTSGGKRRRISVLGIAGGLVAASVAIGIILFPRPDTPVPQARDILSYVEDVADSIHLYEKNVRLVLSEHKTIVLNEDGTDISYDEEQIVIADDGISKTEAAETNQLIVPYGRRSKLTLADGTQVWVNSGTKVVYPVEFDSGPREIYVSGEVYLDVAHDPSRPFIVRTGGFDVEVLGTRFNVSVYRNEPENVVLTSGSVRIAMEEKSEKVVLRPDQMFRIEDGVAEVSDVDTELYTSWVRGLYIFDNERLDAVMRRLSKYYGISVECSPDAGSLRCSGKLNLIDNFDDILNSLSMISSIKYVSNNDHYRIF